MFYQFKKSMGFASVDLKFQFMRKVKDFVIYPMNKESKFIYLQSDKSCCVINRENGQTVYSDKGSCPMDYYLMYKPTKKFIVPMDFVKDILNFISENKNYHEDGTCEIVIGG